MALRHWLGRAVLCTLVCLLVSFPGWSADLLGADYHIGPGDLLQVQVFGEKELSGEYRVAPSGRINLPAVGAVEVGGLTVEQAQQAIAAALSDLIRRPRIVVSINELESERKVYVGGAVQTPGPLSLPFGSTVLDAVIAAGVRPEADLAHVTLTRPGHDPVTIDLSGWKTLKGVPKAELLRYGDVLFVPEQTDRITVLGAVAQPVSLPPFPGKTLRVLDVIGRAAGGLAPDADPRSAVILHKNGQATHVDLQKLLEEGDMSQNFELKAGDVVVVRKAKHISVVGQVSTPAVFVSGEPVPVLVALARAGQILPSADLAKAKIVGKDGSRKVDLKALIETGKGAEDLTLNPGDVLVIPEAAPQEVLIAGSVTRPGPVDISRMKQHDLLRVLTTVGLTPDGDGTRVCILRGDEQIVVNYKAMLEKAELGKNVALEAGDVVFVPPLDKVYVIGAVGAGGSAIPCPDEGLAIMDALIAAGGFNERANPNDVHVVRPRPDGSTEHVQVKLGDLRKGKAPVQIVLKPGDIVYVGARGKKFTWRDIGEILWTVGAVKTLVD
ncbi:MAG: polysaccharide biosynthesis/export family protein [Armatimonadetes bacterium]|nr:polysaccharide biosynthesis/export family protein [Armatimonadota bacterium]